MEKMHRNKEKDKCDSWIKGGAMSAVVGPPYMYINKERETKREIVGLSIHWLWSAKPPST